MAQEPHPSAEPVPDGHGDRTSLLDLLLVLARRKRLVFGLPFGAACVAAIVTLLMPNVFTATAKIMPPPQSQQFGTAALLGQLGVISGGGAVKNPSEVLAAMIRTRTVMHGVINRFDLKKIYHKDLMVDAQRALEERTRIAVSREGVLSIDVDDTNPILAASIANGFVDELQKLQNNLGSAEASQRRLYFDKHLKQAKNDLSTAENNMRAFKERTGLVFPEGQAALSVSASASVRAQVTAKEIQLAAMRAFATDRNPDLQRTEIELAGLRSQLSKMEADANQGKGDVLMSIGNVPGATTDYVRLYRDYKYQEMLHEILARQYETARLDELKAASPIQILDLAIAPEKKSKPRRTQIVLVTAVAVFFLSALIALVLNAYERARADPLFAEKLDQLRNTVRRR